MFDIITEIFFYKRFGLRQLLFESESYIETWKKRIQESWVNGKPSLSFDFESIKVFIELYKEYRVDLKDD